MEKKELFDEKMLNKVYAAATEFGANWLRPIPEIMEEFCPELSDADKRNVGEYIEQTKDDIETFFYERYEHSGNPKISDDSNRKLETDGYKWIKAQYEWMSEKNVIHAVNQGMYFAWHG